MESSEKIREWISTLGETIGEQAWFQQLKSKWEELDPQSRLYLQFAAAGSAVLLIIIFTISSIWSVHRLKKELSEKRELLNVIQSSNEEISRLRRVMPGAGKARNDSDEGMWAPYFESIGLTAGVDKPAITLGSEKAGASTEQAKEILLEVTLKHLNIKQIIRYAYAVENGQRPAKIRNLSIDTKGDPTGYLDATLAISAFSLVVPQ